VFRSLDAYVFVIHEMKILAQLLTFRGFYPYT